MAAAATGPRLLTRMVSSVMPRTHDGYLNDHHREIHRLAKLLLLDEAKKSPRPHSEALVQALRIRRESSREIPPEAKNAE